MDSVIVVAASYVIWLMVAGFAAYWLIGENHRGKVTLAFSAVAGLALVVALIAIASASYDDPRPFVADPSIVPLIDHEPDNGFPSNHAAAVGLMATLVALRRPWWGLPFGLAAAIVAWARVAAHVHHLLDVLVGLALGAVAAWLATVLVTLLLRKTHLLDRLAWTRAPRSR